MNRRNFLKLAGLSSVAVAAGAAVFRVGFWWDQMPGERFEVLSDDEAVIVASIADAMWPGDVGAPPLPNGVDVGTVAAFDGYLSRVDDQTSQVLRLALHAIDDMAVMSDLGLTRFHKRPRAERIEILKAWDSSGVLLRRAAFRALKFVLAGHYCNHPEVLRAAGIHYTCGGVV